MDPDVVEIPPPIHKHPPRFKKQKQSVFHDVIDIVDDNVNDDDDLMILGEITRKHNKGKELEALHEGYGDHKVLPGMEKMGTVSGIKSSNGQPSVSQNVIDVDDCGSHPSFDNNDLLDLCSDDYEYTDVDEYDLLQAQFDNVDLPPGVEAPFAWLPEYNLGLEKTGNSTLQPNSSITQGSKISSSSSQIKTDNVDLSSGTQLSSTAALTKKKSGASLRNWPDLNKPLGVESSKSRRFIKSVRSKVKSAFFGSKKQGLADNPDAMKLLPGGKPPYMGQFESAKQGAGSSSSFHSNFVGQDGSLHPSGVESGSPWLKSSHNFNAPPEYAYGSTSGLKSARDVHNGAAVLPRFTIIDKSENETLRKLQSFKQFDTVNDTSDHYFIKNNSPTKQNPKSWAKKIQGEWKILEEHLPETIFVRVYESRMDLMRAVIIGAEGTPYHDGLFFFDIHFPSSYPNVPPKVHYHSGGLRLNPNLYHCGKVCLSLLNTWSGSTNEKWTKGVSTMLQVLVSIQGLILNTNPYFNEPGYEYSRGTPTGEMDSLQYNENTFILSLKTMIYMIKKPPKNFEDLVVGHFYSRAHDILASCKAYMEGVQVGCLVKGGVHDVDGSEGKNCSALLKSGILGIVPSLVREFENVGVNDCEKFMTPPVPPRSITGRN